MEQMMKEGIIAKSICDRLQTTTGNAYFMIPKGGVGRYSKVGGILYNKESDDAFFDYLRKNLPKTIEIVEREEYVEDPVFVEKGVDLLISLIEHK